MISYLAPDTAVVLRVDEEFIELTVRELAAKLVLPVNKFFYDGRVLCNSVWGGTEKEMFWELKRGRDVNALEYLFNAELNRCIEADDKESLKELLMGDAWKGVGLIEQRLSAVETLYAPYTK